MKQRLMCEVFVVAYDFMDYRIVLFKDSKTGMGAVSIAEAGAAPLLISVFLLISADVRKDEFFIFLLHAAEQLAKTLKIKFKKAKCLAN